METVTPAALYVLAVIDKLVTVLSCSSVAAFSTASLQSSWMSNKLKYSISLDTRKGNLNALQEGSTCTNAFSPVNPVILHSSPQYANCTSHTGLLNVHLVHLKAREVWPGRAWNKVRIKAKHGCGDLWETSSIASKAWYHKQSHRITAFKWTHPGVEQTLENNITLNCYSLER